MEVRFLLGPAGSGKTYRCVAEVREALRAGGGGLPLLFLAPKQATFQLERQILMDGGVDGFERLEILSFERLSRWILERTGVREPRLLGEEGRVMVLRSLLGREEARLRYFGRCARSPGLAREVSNVLRTFQEHGVGVGKLEELAGRGVLPEALRWKLKDWAMLMAGYQGWLREAGLTDGSDLAWQAVAGLGDGRADPWFERVWLDGFAEMTPAETALLAAVARRSHRTDAAFCLDWVGDGARKIGLWNVVERTFRSCHAALAATTGVEPRVEILARGTGRFRESPVLEALERRMAGEGGVGSLLDPEEARRGVRVVRCADAHEEAEVAAGAVEGLVREGGRFRDAAVLVRSLEEYGPVVARVFRQRGIPCFLDHRHGLRHHPLVELTRTALRVAADPGSEEDWFAWLKCGLLPLEGWEGEELENALRAGRWAGRRWMGSDGLEGVERLAAAMERVTRPLRRFIEAMSVAQDGPGLSRAVRALWVELGVKARLESWDDADGDALRHGTVLNELEGWLGEVERAFAGHPLGVSEWLPVVESAWSGLTAGAVPPSLDQVLIGAVDRSRNPDLSLVVLPGWTEGGFPKSGAVTGLLTNTDREWLEAQGGLGLGPTPVDRIHHEAFYGYIALTRARRQVVVTVPAEGLTGGGLLPSPLLRRWLREWGLESVPPEWRGRPGRGPGTTAGVGGSVGEERLSAGVVRALWAGGVETSASALEQMAGCRFAHFAARVLRLGEREELEVGAREQGTWTHALLAEFHRSLAREGRTWHGLGVEEGRERVRRLAERMRCEPEVSGGGPAVEHALRRAERQVSDWVEHWLQVLGRWPGEPEWVEARFGGMGSWPAVELGLPEGGWMRIVGQVDRVDLLTSPSGAGGAAWVVDYKRGLRQLRVEQVERGFELQLPLYLKAVVEATGQMAGGMTYASLTRTRRRAEHREDAGEGGEYVHRGRINLDAVRRVAGLVDWEALPFSVRLRKDGTPYANADGVEASGVEGVLASAVGRARELGEGLLAGDIAAAPVLNRGVLPCEGCAYRGVCRIDEAGRH